MKFGIDGRLAVGRIYVRVCPSVQHQTEPDHLIPRENKTIDDTRQEEGPNV